MISQQPKKRRTLHKPSVQDEVNKQSLLSLYSFHLLSFAQEKRTSSMGNI